MPWLIDPTVILSFKKIGFTEPVALTPTEHIRCAEAQVELRADVRVKFTGKLTKLVVTPPRAQYSVYFLALFLGSIQLVL